MIDFDTLPDDTQSALRQYIIEIMDSISNGDFPAPAFRHSITTENMTDYRKFLDYEPS